MTTLKRFVWRNWINYTYGIIGWYLLEKIQTLPSMREKFFRKTKKIMNIEKVLVILKPLSKYCHDNKNPAACLRSRYG